MAAGAWMGAVNSVPRSFVVLAILVLLATTRRSAIAPALTVAAVAFLISGIGLDLRSAAYRNDVVDGLLTSRSEVQLTARVTSDPRKTHEKVLGQDRHASRTIFGLRVERIVARDAVHDVRFPALAFTDDLYQVLIPGDCVRFSASGFRLRDQSPGLRVSGPVELCGRASLLQRAAARVRGGLVAASATLPPDARGLLPGLVVGDTAELPDSLESDMRRVNLTHLTAVSGANLAIIAAFVLAMSRGVGLRREAIPIVTALAISFFVVIARPEPSVLRAAVMAAVLIAARMLGSAHAGIAALAFAVIVLVLANPEQASNPGFVLSVCATGGLILWANPLATHFARHLPRWVAVGLSVPLAAQIACTPALVALSGQLSLVGIATNFLAAPLVAPATIGGLVAAVLALIWLPLAHILAWAAGLPVLAIAQVAHLSAAMPFASLPMPRGLGGAVVGAVLCIAWVVGYRRWRWVTLVFAASALIAVVLLSLFQPGWPMRDWHMVACDVGQGDGLVLRIDDTRAVVVDVGPDGAAMRRCLQQLKVKRIELLVITHAHADHMEGLAEVVDTLSIGQVLLPATADPEDQYERLLQMTAGLPRRPVRAGETWRWPELSLTVLWPRYAIHAGSTANNASTVLLATVHRHRILLLGDVEREAQQALPLVRQVSLVKVAHHGSGNQRVDLLDQWNPDVGVVSVGVGNPYGHPHASLLQAFDHRGIPLYRTDRQGSLAFAWRAKGVVVDARGHPFW